nr:immunoglobulin light chain junction region [Macaca mulatta]MOX25763.1 immunoglobulin light chain junction region [Macaca mulatta]MOX26387.1 immunoglobulin light chain junction region [Macaca mulatta]MOX26514.1 immunoglobulin light chain junction region [Macaca mulatta]
CQQGYNVPFTF